MRSRRTTTAEVVARRALEMTPGQECVDWAVDMLAAGRDTPHLRMLAGAVGPHNHFELVNLCDRALEELGEQSVPREQALRLFARERLRAALAGEADLPTEFEVVAHLYMKHEMPRALRDFYLLHFAHQDLQESPDQWYWPDADRTNILDIMKERAAAFVKNET